MLYTREGFLFIADSLGLKLFKSRLDLLKNIIIFYFAMLVELIILNSSFVGIGWQLALHIFFSIRPLRLTVIVRAMLEKRHLT